MSTLLTTTILIISLFLNNVFAYQFYYYCYNIIRNTEGHKHEYTKEKFSGDSVKEYIISKFPNQRDLIEATIDATGTAVTWYGIGNTVEDGIRKINDIARSKSSSSNLNWDTLNNNYQKVVKNGHEYVVIGGELYTRHAIENTYPASFGKAAGSTSQHTPLGLSPKYINDIINNTTPAEVTRNGITRSIYNSGNVQVVTEGGKVITVRYK